MKNLIYLIFILFIFSSCNIKLNKTVIDERTKKEVLIGKCNRQSFDHSAFKNWFQEGYNEYDPDFEIIKKLNGLDKLKNIKIKVVFGTWCSDSRRELPRFYKIIDELGFPESRIQLIGVDKKKSSRNNLLKKIEFTRVPTFIFYIDKNEIGRIIESTEINLETDLYNIIRK